MSPGHLEGGLHLYSQAAKLYSKLDTLGFPGMPGPNPELTSIRDLCLEPDPPRAPCFQASKPTNVNSRNVRRRTGELRGLEDFGPIGVYCGHRRTCWEARDRFSHMEGWSSEMHIHNDSSSGRADASESFEEL